MIVWDPDNTSTVKINDDEYYHPISSKTNPYDAWKFFRCRTGLNYSTDQPVFCLRCCQRMKAKAGEEEKMMFYSLKWKQGCTTSHLKSHIKKKHQRDVQQIEQARVPQGACISVHKEETNERRLTKNFQWKSAISKEQQKSITRDLVWHMVFDDKEPCYIVERPGFQNLIEILCPAYRLPHRTQVIEVADEIADQCLTKVKTLLSQHFENGWTVCLTPDARAKKC